MRTSACVWGILVICRTVGATPYLTTLSFSAILQCSYPLFLLRDISRTLARHSSYHPLLPSTSLSGRFDVPELHNI